MPILLFSFTKVQDKEVSKKFFFLSLIENLCFIRDYLINLISRARRFINVTFIDFPIRPRFEA